MIDYVFKKREKEIPNSLFQVLDGASGGKILKSFSVTQTALAKFYFG